MDVKELEYRVLKLEGDLNSFRSDVKDQNQRFLADRKSDKDGWKQTGINADKGLMLATTAAKENDRIMVEIEKYKDRIQGVKDDMTILKEEKKSNRSAWRDIVAIINFILGIAVVIFAIIEKSK